MLSRVFKAGLEIGQQKIPGSAHQPNPPLKPQQYTQVGLHSGLERHLRKKTYKTGSGFKEKVGEFTSSESKSMEPIPSQ